MIGDDVRDDVLGAINCGMMGCLVKTGKFTSKDEEYATDSALIFDTFPQAVNSWFGGWINEFDKVSFFSSKKFTKLEKHWWIRQNQVCIKWSKTLLLASLCNLKEIVAFDQMKGQRKMLIKYQQDSQPNHDILGKIKHNRAVVMPIFNWQREREK